MPAHHDDQHLHLLSIFHYVFAALEILFGCFPLIYAAFGVFLIYNPPPIKPGDPPISPELIGTVVALFGGILTLIAWALSACILFAGVSLAARRRYLFCLIVAAICCLSFPLGTTLGVFTLIVLSRPSVKAQFHYGVIEADTKDAGACDDDSGRPGRNQQDSSEPASDQA